MPTIMMWRSIGDYVESENEDAKNACTDDDVDNTSDDGAGDDGGGQ